MDHLQGAPRRSRRTGTLAGVALCLLALLGTGQVAAPAQAATVLPRFQGRIVCVEDASARRWPVHAATRAWDRADDVRLVYRRGRGACDGHRQVVLVRSANYGRTGWIGYGRFPRRFASGRIVAVTRLNNTYGTAAHPDNLMYTTLHELGHNLGLAHAGNVASVMSYANRRRTAPTTRDLRTIERLYPW